MLMGDAHDGTACAHSSAGATAEQIIHSLSSRCLRFSTKRSCMSHAQNCAVLASFAGEHILKHYRIRLRCDGRCARYDECPRNDTMQRHEYTNREQCDASRACCRSTKSVNAASSRVVVPTETVMTFKRDTLQGASCAVAIAAGPAALRCMPPFPDGDECPVSACARPPAAAMATGPRRVAARSAPRGDVGSAFISCGVATSDDE